MNVLHRFFKPPDPAVLTQRERDVARLVADGWSNAAIAKTLGVKQKTVEHYLTLVYSKMSADFDCKERNMRAYLGAIYRLWVARDA